MQSQIGSFRVGDRATGPLHISQVLHEWGIRHSFDWEARPEVEPCRPALRSNREAVSAIPVAALASSNVSPVSAFCLT